jgi:hypothetical protein
MVDADSVGVMWSSLVVHGNEQEVVTCLRCARRWTCSVIWHRY